MTSVKPELAALDNLSYKLLSVSTKLLTLVIDPNRRPSHPTRKQTVDFLDTITNVCDHKI